MLFIVGIKPGSKSLGKSQCVCPACGKSVDLQLSKDYSVFSFFFIPIFSFGASYLATCPNCASVMKLSREKGKSFEQAAGSVIHNGDLHILQNNADAVCPACGTKIITEQNFCYHCGVRLS